MDTTTKPITVKSIQCEAVVTDSLPTPEPNQQHLSDQYYIATTKSYQKEYHDSHKSDTLYRYTNEPVTNQLHPFIQQLDYCQLINPLYSNSSTTDSTNTPHDDDNIARSMPPMPWSPIRRSITSNYQGHRRDTQTTKRTSRISLSLLRHGKLRKTTGQQTINKRSNFTRLTVPHGLRLLH
mmetsp:Transcript_5064/g.7756  ORF Transcript_5064/g.7756 Transcript_5064/m.7756 type:complete len:180 (-) Transcript_5064:133-672(-)